MAPFFVTTATGNQGGATARALLSSGHQVHALVRDPSSAEAKALEAAGATLFQGSFSDVPALKRAAAGCIGVFVNALPSFSSPTAEFDEVKNIIDASLVVGVKHVIYTSILGLKEDQHKDLHRDYPILMAKYAIEKAVRDAGFETWTILRPGYFMSNFKGPMASLQYPELATGLFKSAFKPTAKLPFIDTRDIGTIAAKVFEDPGKWNGMIIDIYYEVLTVESVVRILGEVNGKEFRAEQVENGENLTGVQGIFYNAQKLLEVAYEEAILESDLTPLKELRISFRGFEQFLRDEE